MIALSIMISLPCAAQEASAYSPVLAYNKSGQDLFARLAQSPGNILISPYSIGIAMAMVMSGARGDTEREMRAILKHTQSRQEIDRSNEDIRSTIDRRGVLVANALALTRRDNLVSPAYEQALRENYAAEVLREAKVADINSWVKQKTSGKIDKILNEVDKDSAAILLNAIYIKSRWNAPFSVAATQSRDFHISSSKRIKVPTMHQVNRYALINGDGFRAIRLQYAERNLSMVVVLPNDVEGLSKISARLTAADVLGMFRAQRASVQDVRVTLPRFKAAYTTNVDTAFKQANLKLAFDKTRADFSGMSGKPVPPVELYLDQFIHRTAIEVNEEGTEAAAATGAGMAVIASVPSPPVDFAVNRPFQFFIVEGETGAILFQGRVADPSAENG